MYQVPTYPRELYFSMALGEFSAWPGVATTAWLSLAAMVFFARVAAWDRPATKLPPRPLRLGWGRAVGAILAALAVAIIVGVPLGNFLYHVGIQVEQVGGEHVRHWSLAKAAVVLWETPGRYRNEIRWTLLIGAAAATLSVLVAAPLAWLARRGGWRAIPALLAAAVGMAVPGPLIGLSMIRLFNQPGAPWLWQWFYDKTILAPTVAMLFRTAPWAILICWFAFRSVPKETLEAAELDGAGPVMQLLWIAIPLRWPALALAWLVSLAVATGDVAASILVVPPGIETLAVRIYGLIHFGSDEQVSAICLMIAATVFLTTAVVWRLIRRNASAAWLVADSPEATAAARSAATGSRPHRR
jgi:iron(III) transport system permease protein